MSKVPGLQLRLDFVTFQITGPEAATDSAFKHVFGVPVAADIAGGISASLRV